LIGGVKIANVYVGDSRKLVFPVMCDGYLKIEYDDTNTNASKGNLWNHNGSFVFETIITPYDVNGFGHATDSTKDTLDSTKTPPCPATSDSLANFESGAYFGTSRFSHKMMLFYNGHFQVYLENTTAHNFNQPAEYKIVVKLANTASGSPVYYDPIETGTVIKSINTLHGYYDPNGYYDGNNTSLTKLQGDTTVSGNTITFPNGPSDTVGADNVATLADGSELFNSNGVSLGVVTEKNNANAVSVADASNHTAAIYVSQPKEAFYVEQLYKISCVFNKGGSVDIYLNNSLIKSEKFSSEPTFAFKADDVFIGQKGDEASGAREHFQFMGELYEVSLSKGSQPSQSLNTLSPSYSNILFYYTFGE
tara:strand:- start:88 stop:1179 length:1092 start_codon:yes stop_codon:yes gene_type:complete